MQHILKKPQTIYFASAVIIRLTGNAIFDGCNPSEMSAPTQASKEICSRPAADHPADVASHPIV
jgi:hypothetical protein